MDSISRSAGFCWFRTCANFANLRLAKFSLTALFPTIINGSALILSFLNIFRLRSFAEMFRIEAQTCIARMKASRLRPASMYKKERNSMDSESGLFTILAEHHDVSVTITGLGVWPEQARIGVAVCCDHLLHYVEKEFSGRLGLIHLCSSKAGLDSGGLAAQTATALLF